ncbi:MAG: S41 family peptidase, partial [Candidatus Levybacteria bacterium]|nr:S41 family peptidase [Candidatus Levybacteria bacterium]
MRTVRFFLLLFSAFLIGYYFGVTKITIQWKTYQPHIEITSKEPPPSVSYIDFTQFWTVLAKLEQSYYDKRAFDSQKILEGAITGLVSSFDDPYTVYLPRRINNEFKQGLAGQFEGIGAELGIRDDKQIIIVAPLDGSPAKKAGLKPQDAILKVDGELTSGWSVTKAVENIRGKKGTKVTLTILREKEEKPRDVDVVRDTITVKSVSAWTKKISEIDGIKKSAVLAKEGEKKIAYIRLSQFGDLTNQEWTQAIKGIASIKNDQSLSGIVFDLRNNPGGYLSDAVFIASEFLPNGTTVVLQEDSSGARNKLTVEREGTLQNIPLVVLINKGSASASEIVAGALSDHKRATLIGEISFGKGTIQKAEELAGGAGLHITVAKWLTPNGTFVHKKGITPD